MESFYKIVEKNAGKLKFGVKRKWSENAAKVGAIAGMSCYLGTARTGRELFEEKGQRKFGKVGSGRQTIAETDLQVLRGDTVWVIWRRSECDGEVAEGHFEQILLRPNGISKKRFRGLGHPCIQSVQH